MTLAHMRRRDALLSLAAFAAVPLAARSADSAPKLPGDSVYRLDVALEDHDGRPFSWSSLQGGPVLASMFYTSCDKVCPMIFETIHATLRALPAADRAATRVLMVSFDPARDSVEVLKKTAQARGCDERWVLARADDRATRQVAAVLGVQFRRLSDGEYNHSSTIDVLDPAGRIVARSAKLGPADPKVTAAIRKMTARG
jgi:protein SCO1/2